VLADNPAEGYRPGEEYEGIITGDHFGMGRAAAELMRDALGGGPEILYRLHLDLASLSDVEYYPDGGTSVRLVNDTSHHPAT